MTGGEKALIIGAGGLAIVAFLKYRQNSIVSPPVLTVTKEEFVPILPIPGFAQAANILKPIADKVTTPFIHKVNETVGGTNAYGIKSVTNSDGSITTFEGPSNSIEITHYPDGHETHKVNYSVNPKVKVAAKAAWGTTTAIVSLPAKAVTSLVSGIKSIF